MPKRPLASAFLFVIVVVADGAGAATAAVVVVPCLGRWRQRPQR